MLYGVPVKQLQKLIDSEHFTELRAYDEDQPEPWEMVDTLVNAIVQASGNFSPDKPLPQPKQFRPRLIRIENNGRHR